MSVDQLAGRPAENDELPENIGLPAFRTMAQGYKFVFTRLLVVMRLAWKDFLCGFLLAILYQIAGGLFFDASTLWFAPYLVGIYFVLRFTVRWHHYVMATKWSDDMDYDGRINRITLVYLSLFAICGFVLTAPLFVVSTLVFAENLPEAWLTPAFAVLIALDFYLIARMSILFPQTAILGTLPPRWTWSLSQGLVWKLILIMSLAPWPFNVAFKLLEEIDAPSPWVQLAIALLAAIIMFVSMAVIATILTDAYMICVQRNRERIVQAREAILSGQSPG
jgi:hypothetical protein